jgi:hypothetical protein
MCCGGEDGNCADDHTLGQPLFSFECEESEGAFLAGGRCGSDCGGCCRGGACSATLQKDCPAQSWQQAEFDCEDVSVVGCSLVDCCLLTRKLVLIVFFFIGLRCVLWR